MGAGTDKHADEISEASLKLLMYRIMPAQENAWLAGYDAAQANMDLEVNLYKKTDDEYESWENGWWDAFYEINNKLYQTYNSDDASKTSPSLEQKNKPRLRP